MGGMMSEHYCSEKPYVDRAPQTRHARLRGKTYTFTSDRGVFSKNAVDFGSQLMIEQFREPQVAGDILDLGCGYGPVGITLAYTYDTRHVVLTDVGERALLLTKQNIQLNHINNISIIQRKGLSEVINRTFLAVVTHAAIRADKKVSYKIFGDAKYVLKDGCHLWVVIQKKQGAPSAKAELQNIFGNVDIVSRDKGYYILQATKV